MTEETIKIATNDNGEVDIRREEIDKFNAYVYRGRCVRIVDGDTYDILVDCGFGIYHKIRVRLRGVDTPEKYGKNACEEGRQASEAMDKLLFDRVVIIRTYKEKASSYNRWEADVWYEDDETSELTSVARKIVDEGWGVLVEGYEI